MGGYTGSSTRTELSAALIAIAANGPVHIGTDSKAFRDKAIQLLHKLRNKRPIKTNWKTTADGDLWEDFVKAAKAKNAYAIRITKVKGHVTDEQVTNKDYRLVDKLGNDQADAAADIGVKVHGADTIRLANIMRIRYKQYTTLMIKIAKHLVEGDLIPAGSLT